MTASRSLVLLLLLTVAVFADQPFHANLRFGNIPDGAKPAAFTSDAAGNFYIVSNITEPSGRPQLRIDKVDFNGTPLANFEFGGSGGDYVGGMAIDPAGNIVIVGSTLSPDFPLVSPLMSTPESPAGFIAKVNPQLNNILFSTKLGGTQEETTIQAVAIDKAGNIYVTGATYDTDFPITPGAFQKQPPINGSLGPAEYAFVTAISSGGTALSFSTYFGDSALSCPKNQDLCPPTTTVGSAIVLDPSGNVIIAGSTTASGLPVTSGTFGMNCGGCGLPGEAGFFAKFSPDGSTLIWGTFLPVISNSEFFSIIQITTLGLDAAGNVLAAGSSSSPLPITVDALQHSFPGLIQSQLPQNVGFLMKFDSSAQQVRFCTYFGGAGEVPEVSISVVPTTSVIGGVQALAIDSQGVVWLTGTSSPSELPVAAGTADSGEEYLAGLSSDGSTLLTIFTAPTGAAGEAIALATNGATALGSTGALLTASPGQSPSLTGIVNSAGFATSDEVAPYELISIYGLSIGPQTPLAAQVVNSAVGNDLNGVQVLFDGMPAPLLYAGPTQLDAIVPSEVYGHDTTTIQILTPSGRLNGPTMQVRPSQPGVVLSAALAPGMFLPAAPPAAALNQDGSVNSAAKPAALGSIVSVWVSGAGLSSYGQTDGGINTIGGQPILPVTAFSSSLFPFGLWEDPLSLEVVYAGDAVGMVAGVTQVNFRLPDYSGIGSQNIGFWLQIGNASSQLFTLYLKAPN